MSSSEGSINFHPNDATGDIKVYSKEPNLVLSARPRERHRSTENKHPRKRKSRVNGMRKSRITTETHSRSNKHGRVRADKTNVYGYVVDIPGRKTKRRSFRGYPKVEVLQVNSSEKSRKSERRKNRTSIKRSTSRDKANHKNFSWSHSFAHHPSKHSRHQPSRKNRSVPLLRKDVLTLNSEQERVTRPMTWVVNKGNGRSTGTLLFCPSAPVCAAEYNERCGNKRRKKSKRRKRPKPPGLIVEKLPKHMRIYWKDGNGGVVRSRSSRKFHDGIIAAEMIDSSFERSAKYPTRNSCRIVKAPDVQIAQVMDQQHAHSDDASVRGMTTRKKKKSSRKLNRKKRKHRMKMEPAKRFSQQQAFSDDESVRLTSPKKKKGSQKLPRKKKRASRLKKRQYVNKVRMEYDHQNSPKTKSRRNEVEPGGLPRREPQSDSENRRKLNVSRDIGDDCRNNLDIYAEGEGRFLSQFSEEDLATMKQGEPSVANTPQAVSSSDAIEDGWEAGEEKATGEEHYEFDKITESPIPPILKDWENGMSKISLSARQPEEPIKFRKQSRNEGQVLGDLPEENGESGVVVRRSSVSIIRHAASQMPQQASCPLSRNRENNERVKSQNELQSPIVKIWADYNLKDIKGATEVERVPRQDSYLGSEMESDEKSGFGTQDDTTRSTSALSGINEGLINLKLLEITEQDDEGPAYCSPSNISKEHVSAVDEAVNNLFKLGSNMDESGLALGFGEISGGRKIQKVVSQQNELDVFGLSVRHERSEPVRCSRLSTPHHVNHCRNESDNNGKRIQILKEEDDLKTVESIELSPNNIRQHSSPEGYDQYSECNKKQTTNLLFKIPISNSEDSFWESDT